MAHKIDFTTGRAAFTRAAGSKAAWHKLGGETPADAPIETWLTNAGLDFHVYKAPSFVKIGDDYQEVPNVKHMVRDDTLAVLGTHTDGYQVHQPREIVEHMRDSIMIDPRFTFETMGALKEGRTIWGLARYAESAMIGGAPHNMYILAATSFDGSMATIERATSVCVVCDNTLGYSNQQDGASQIKITHRSQFQGDKRDAAAEKFARIVAQFEQFKVMGDALAQVQMSKDELNAFFRSMLDIPAGAARGDISARKINQYDDMIRSLQTANRAEASEAPNTRFAALQAVTRYVDHERSTKKGADGVEASRFYSSQFGSGAALKTRAVDLLTA